MYPASGTSSSQLWVDKHKPRGFSELIGNPSLFATLRQWLRDWRKLHVAGVEPAIAKGSGRGKAMDMSKKAVLLSGAPGIGKTTAAHIISR